MSDRIFSIGESGIEASDERIKSLMNNMVNAQTPGFKSSDVSQVSFPSQLDAAMNRIGSMQPKIDSAYYDHAPGALIRTGSPTDLAIGGDGFFVINGPWGTGFTRDGRFILDKEGLLVTVSGKHPVMGQSGHIVVPAGSKLSITNRGEIKVDDVTVDTIKVVHIENKETLDSVSGSVFKFSGEGLLAEEIETPRVIQGYVESSNVSMVDEMMNLVMLSRLYGVNVKVIESRNEALSRAVEMGRMQ